MHRVLLLGVLWGFGFSAYAHVYKCVDTGGNTSYSQSPCPPGAKSMTIRQTVPPAPPPPPKDAGKDRGRTETPAPRSAPPAGSGQASGERAQSGKAADQRKLAIAKVRAENCQNARLRLANLNASATQFQMDANGERTYLDPSQIAREKAKARNLIAQWCK